MEEKLTPVRVKLMSRAKPEHGEADEPIRLMCRGQLRALTSGYMLRYQEVQQIEGETAPSMQEVLLMIQPGRVTMNRLGEYGTTMVFMKDRRFEGAYHTPYGDLGMALYTIQVHTDLHPDHGSIHLEYQLDMQGSYAAVQMIDVAWQAEETPC